MEIGPSTLASREISLNKHNTDQDILQKTLEKSKQAEQQGQSKPVEQVNTERQGGIDLYA